MHVGCGASEQATDQWRPFSAQHGWPDGGLAFINYDVVMT